MNCSGRGGGGQGWCPTRVRTRSGALGFTDPNQGQLRGYDPPQQPAAADEEVHPRDPEPGGQSHRGINLCLAEVEMGQPGLGSRV